MTLIFIVCNFKVGVYQCGFTVSCHSPRTCTQSVYCPVQVCVCVFVRADDGLVTCPVNAGLDSSTMTNDFIKEGPLLGKYGKCSHAQLPRRFYCVVSLQRRSLFTVKAKGIRRDAREL